MFFGEYFVNKRLLFIGFFSYLLIVETGSWGRISYFDIAKKLFENGNKEESTLHPNWGRDTNDYYSEQCE